ncbi:MAG TPA: DUF4968 domain-containing protein [Bacteroidales bacterium]|nr:DUF4968 domain-containing protein [Bacteroidales bacterium]
MKVYRLLLLIYFAWVLIPVASATDREQAKEIRPGNITNYTVDGKEVVFTCENNFKIKLALLGSEVIKVWMDPQGAFSRSNPSFAVINEAFEGIDAVNIQETTQGYEIYTGALILRINARPFRLSIFDKYQRLLLEDYQENGFVQNQNDKVVYKTLKKDEIFLGLGEKGGSLNRRGQSFTMWNSDKPCYSADEDPLYKSIPFFMSSYGYGVFLDNTYKTEFKMGSESDDYFSFQAPGGEMIYYVMYGPEYKQLIRHYTHLTGQPIMPPNWALGFSQSRGLLTREDLTRDIAEGYRSRNIPCDIIYQDIGWTQHLQDFNWREGNYDNPQKMLSDLAEKGFKVVISQDPVISQVNSSQWFEADSLGYFATDIRTGESYDMPWPWGGHCGVVDFTNPEVADWWGDYQQKPINDGVKGFWTDMGEPAWSNEEDVDRLNMQHHAGMHDEIHNVYGLEWDRIVTEQFEKHNPNTRIFQMTRAAYAGLQRYTFGWSGDAGHGGNVLNGWSSLAGQIPLALSSGMGLIPFWATDISGYCGDISSYSGFAELYTRWLQFGAFNPLSRIHHEGNNAVEPWLFGDEVLEIIKDAIELKYQLFPYLYSYSREAYDTGLPIMRATILEYPDDAEALKAEHQFLFGSELLVAPVVEQYAAVKRVYLPAGEWVDFNDPSKVYRGRQWMDYPVDLATVPIFIKKGSIIPMMPVMQYIHEDENYPLTFKVFPAGNGHQATTFALYEDDGESNDYKRDQFGKRIIRYRSNQTGAELEIATKESGGFQLSKRDYQIKIVNTQEPRRIELNGKRLRKVRKSSDFEKLQWYWDKDTNTCIINLPEPEDKLTIKLTNQ